MSRIDRREPIGVGEDSFLDTTANLVGILIILVVVIGTKTKLDAEEYGRKLAEDQQPGELVEPQREARALFESLQDQKLEYQRYELETEYRQLERDQLLAKVAIARSVVEEEMSSVDEQQREAVERSKEIDRLKSELEEIDQQLGVKEQVERPKIILEHLPTPMARTVFTQELHVQIQHGQVTVIPWDRLVDILKQQIPLAAQRKGIRGGLEDNLGPVGGFVMHYRMDAIPGGLALNRFELEATSSAPRESLEESLGPAGRLRLELSSREAHETVVTVWVYPDSFEQFRQLKARLFQEGFLSAARPLPEGVLIGASPQGTRSSAQ